jgi:excisionase family DNA binding protein
MNLQRIGNIVTLRMAKLSTSQAAKKLNISRQHVVRLCKAGVLNGTRLHEKSWWQVELPKKEEAP